MFVRLPKRTWALRAPAHPRTVNFAKSIQPCVRVHPPVLRRCADNSAPAGALKASQCLAEEMYREVAEADQVLPVTAELLFPPALP